MPEIQINKIHKNSSYIPQEDATQQMTDFIEKIFDALSVDNNIFDAEQIFDYILSYIKKYDRVMYAPITAQVYFCCKKDENDRSIGSLMSNIDLLIKYVQGEKIAKRIDESEPDEKKILKDTRKAIFKIYDHVNLAQRQYQELKQTEEEYRKMFDKSIDPIKEKLQSDVEDVTKKINDIYSQLLTIVGIFTALAFLLFGGITSLGNVFNNTQLPVLKLIIVACIWSLGILNTVFVFLFCIEKITSLDFGNSEKKQYSIFRKYLIVWWSDFFIIAILTLTSWLYYIQNREIFKWFESFCKAEPEITSVTGFAIIAGIIGFVMRKLYEATKLCHNDKKKEDLQK